jgi:hypothetical protein
VDVDHFRAAAGHHDLAPPSRRLRLSLRRTLGLRLRL